MAGIGKQFKGSGIAKSGFSSKHEQARDHLKSGGLTPIGNLRIPRRVKGELNMLAEGGSAKPGLWANINRRKKLGISRPKSKSTISSKAYANMKAGFPKKNKS